MPSETRRIPYSPSAVNPMPVSSSEVGELGAGAGVGGRAVIVVAVKLAVWLAPLMVTAWLGGVYVKPLSDGVTV